MSKKIFILLPDGVGLKNFAFSSFPEIGKEYGWEIIFLNLTSFDLKKLDFNEIKVKGRPSALTDIYKRARKNIELDIFERKFSDPVYRFYKFPTLAKGFKSKFKELLVIFFSSYYNSESGLKKLRKKMEKTERNNAFYKECLNLLKEEQPDFVFCPNQRPVTAIAPLKAAKDLGITTCGFIFSWDNLPKATLVAESDYYFVWSNYMKYELQKYYPFIRDSQIIVTGTPQFEPHFDPLLRLTKGEFYHKYALEEKKEYLCFSGDDITTSPHDDLYLKDVAEAVLRLNSEGENLGIIFRRCPTDFTPRFDKVLSDYKEVIISVDPLWNKEGEQWNNIRPTKDDLELQTNIINNTFMVINVGSSMVFDFVSYEKPCAYINYNPEIPELKKDIHKIYKYVHFRSMPDENPVIWLNSSTEIQEKIKMVRNGNIKETVLAAGAWFKKINLHPPAKASERIWNGIEKII